MPRPLVFPDLVLATRSPRRRRLAAAAGLSHRMAPVDLDDAEVSLSPRLGGPGATMALAWFKARRAAERGGFTDSEVVLAADTLCELDGTLLGQPRDEAAAAAMLRSMVGRVHRTVTGLCLLDPRGGGRMIWHEAAEVSVGGLSDAAIREYLAVGAWSGKAGAYSLEERLAAGWPIECRGDPEVVLGLPTRSLQARLEAWARRRGSGVPR